MSLIAYSNVTVINVNDGDSYIIQSSNSSIVLNKDGNYSPSKITLSGKYKQGADGLKDYSGRVKIETTSDNNNWITQYASNVNESSVTYKFPDPLIDQMPYKFRTSYSGDRMDDEIVGGTVAWNQLFTANSFSGRQLSGIEFSYNNGIFTFSGTPTTNNYIDLHQSTYVPSKMVVGHRYLICSANKDVYNVINNPYTDGSSSQWRNKGYIFYTPTAQPTYLYTRLKVQTNVSISGTASVTVFDLTTMFGTEVADYIYGLEQANAGAGVAYFRKLFPEDYYEYCEPELRHVEGLQKHETVGFNLFDKSTAVMGKFVNNDGNEATDNKCFVTDYIRVFPNTTYYVTHAIGRSVHSIACCEYDNDKGFANAISALIGTNTSMTIVTGANTAYLRVNATKTYIDSLCINISDPSRNRQYEPYDKHSYHLDSSLTLRGIPKLGDNGLYFDGDKYKADGTVERRYGIVDLGTLSWGYYSSTNHFYITINDSIATGTNFMCSKYVYNGIASSSVMSDKPTGLYRYGNIFRIKDTSYTDVATFKAAMSGVYLVYELATPTTETAQPYTALQIVDANGTEEYVSTSIVPVGHYTKYSKNITNIRCSLYEADGFKNLLDQSTIPVIDNIDDKIFLIKVVPEYTVYTSATNLPSTVIWTETKPNTVDASHYLWIRMRSDFSDNSHIYSDAICDVTISGVISDVNKNTKSITDKVWESDITTKINQYDGSTVKTIRDRVTKTETNIDGITNRVTSVEGVTDSLGTRLTTAESNITQNENKISAMVTVNDQTSSITLTENMVEAVTNQFIIKGSDNSTTVISGGKIHTNSIKTNDLATDAIKSSNYQAGPAGSPYSTFGSFLDLSNGNFYTPNFGIQSTGTTGAFINGEIIATAGRIGEDANTAWDIGTFTDFDANDHGSIIGHGDAFIQSGKWMISGNKIDTRWYDNSLKLTYLNYNNTYYDYGMMVP